ncbi:metabotropic glutamate receptor 1-like [Periplaneta americana]|uniref:metabotropic glutamate receptor 1-like n=1 Tax=Periplaneta americana TaxID=6978 RepID=UPI0037E701CD
MVKEVPSLLVISWWSLCLSVLIICDRSAVQCDSTLVQQTEQEQGRISALLKGDFIIGALFSVHHQPKQKRAGNTLKCGEVREMYGIQRIEVTFQTIDRINKDPSILSNVTLGVEIRDSCWYAPVALQQSIEFIRDAISPATSADTCSLDQQPDPRRSPRANAVKQRRSPLVGVIGPASSSVAIQVQNLLQLFQIPQIGYSTTSKDLSDKSRFSYFLRVVPSDYYQAQVMVDIVRKYNWTYVSAVNTDENYGQSGIQAFRELAEKANVCIAKEDSVLSNAEDDMFDSVILKLNEDQNARVVVCFCEGMTVRGLLAATKRLNLTGRFLFLGSDGWADRSDVTDGYESQARGSISIRINSPNVTEFDDYYFNLNPYNNARNPWFREFWQYRFNCTMRDDDGNSSFVFSKSIGTSAERGECTGREKLSDRYKADPKLSFIIKAIYTMAYGLHNMHQDVCGRDTVGLCPELFPFNGSLFKSYLLNVTFTYEDEEQVEFDRRGDPPGRYNIMNFQQLSNGSYDYVRIGDWNNGTLIMRDDLQWPRPDEKVESVCSRPCQPGHYKNFQTGGQEQKCCWICVACKNNEFLKDDTTCEACPAGYLPNANKTDCEEIPAEFVQWSDTQAIVSIAFSCLGFLSTAFAGAVFVRYNNTPVVKSSTRELSYLILAGMTLSHAATFPILAQPSWLSCSLSRLLPGLSFAMIYASLLTKTNRIARILAGSKKRFPTRKPRFMSAAAQVFITCTLIGMEVGVSATMLILEPPAPTLLFPTFDRVVLACNTTPLGVVAPLAFDFFLIALCTLYAIKTRNVPENFNEAKFIGFAMYTTCVIWIAFVPIYFGSDSKVITMCMCVTLSAMVTLVFLFLPKMYIILLRPERNNRALFTTSKSIRCHIGSSVASAISNKSSNSYSSTESPRDRSVTFRKPGRSYALTGSNHSAAAVGSSSNNSNSRGPATAWRTHGETSELVFTGLVTTERQTERRTLSCQTGNDLLQYLLQIYARRMQISQAPEQQKNEAEVAVPQLAELSPRALLDSMNTTRLRRNVVPTPHILEESASEQSGDEDSGQLKHITISLGDCDCRSDSSSHSPISWSHNSDSAM